MGHGMSSRGGIGRADVVLIPPVRGEGGAAEFLAVGAVAKYLVYRRAGEFVVNSEAEAGAVKGGVLCGGHRYWNVVRV